MKIQLYNAWILSLSYVIVNIAFILIMPKYNVRSFVTTPAIRYVNTLNHLSYYGFLLSGIFIPFSEIKPLFFSGICIFVFGILMYTYALFSFAVKEFNKPVTDRFYKYSRHPAYLSFFVISTGISLASFSILLGSFACIYFVSSYFIMKEEEKMCLKKFGDEYRQYMKETKMII